MIVGTPPDNTPNVLITNRVDQWSVTVSIDSVPWGVFDARTGGDLDSTDTKFRSGGMGVEYSLGGTTTVNNVVLRRNYQMYRDHSHMHNIVPHRIGKARCRCGAQPLDADGNPYGKPIIWNGVLKRVQFPDHDSNASDAGMLEIEISVDGSVTVGA